MTPIQLPDITIPVKSPATIKLYIMVHTGDPIMDQIELELSPQQHASLLKAKHLMIAMSISGGEGTDPSRAFELLFPPDMILAQAQSKSASR